MSEVELIQDLKIKKFQEFLFTENFTKIENSAEWSFQACLDGRSLAKR